jgi:hybrid cluster-associated redox disulfide protein
MYQPNLRDMTVSEILRRWPATFAVFLDLRMHCIGCPIGIFHTPADAAKEYALPLDLLLAELEKAIAGRRVKGGPAGALRRSGKAGAARGSAASDGLPPPVRRVPRR